MTDVIVVEEEGNSTVVDLVDDDPPAVIDVAGSDGPPAVIEITTGAPGPVGPPGTGGGGGGGSGVGGNIDTTEYTYNSTITPSATMDGQLRFNVSSVAQSTATMIYVSTLNADGEDVTFWYNLFHVGDEVVVQDADNVMQWIQFTIAGEITGSEGFFSIPVKYVYDNLPQTVGQRVRINLLRERYGTVAVGRDFNTPMTDQFLHITIHDDDTDEAEWPERIRFNFEKDGILSRTGFFNEYGEIRGIAAKLNSVAARFFGREDPFDPGVRDTSVPILEICDDRSNRTRLLGSFSNGRLLISGLFEAASAAITGAITAGSLSATGTVTGSNIGNAKVSQGPVAPSSPAVGDVWVDTN